MSGSLPNIYGLVLNYVLNISLFYFNAHIVLQYFGEKLKSSWFIIIFIVGVEILVFVAFKYPINLMIMGEGIRLNTNEDFRMYAVSNILRSFYYISFSTVYWFSIITVQRNNKINEMETQRLHQENERVLLQKDLVIARNLYLQSQINPHFLFNTLSFMYNASIKVSEKLSNSIMTLSDIMRYALTNIDEDQKVLLEKEIEHIRNFIELNQARYEQRLNLHFDVEGTIGDARIIPLSLITIVENVFKYGDLLDTAQPASVLISVENCKMEFLVSNKKRTGITAPGQGTGLKNLRERLEVHYPKSYTLEVNNNETHYSLTFIINLN